MGDGRDSGLCTITNGIRKVLGTDIGDYTSVYGVSFKEPCMMEDEDDAADDDEDEDKD